MGRELITGVPGLSIPQAGNSARSENSKFFDEMVLFSSKTALDI